MQKQIDSLNIKIDALQGAVEQLNTRVSDSLMELKLQMTSQTSPQASIVVPLPEEALHRQPAYTQSPIRQYHKDILADEAYGDIDSSCGENSLSPEVQTQRLTAQLTAAYNRIAALEEQLLDCRINN